jgi:hypothetical protein
LKVDLIVVNTPKLSRKQLQVTCKVAKEVVTIWLISTSDQYRLKKKIACVKNEGSNLITMITILKSTIKCEVLGLNESFEGTCFGHVFFKTC